MTRHPETPLPQALPQAVLPDGVRARFLDGVNGLRMHVLEAGWQGEGRPLLLLLHGFPELAFSWRKLLPALADDGYHVVAPDQRGYGRTTGWDASYDGALAAFRPLNLVRDIIGLTAALGRRSVAAVIGHDFGAPVAAWCALIRGDVFGAVAMMSAPFGGPPAAPFAPVSGGPDIHRELAALPRPRKHYQWYYSSREANADMRDCPQGVGDFLRAYYHHKSADWPGNRPVPLAGWTAAELARMPTYYIMDLERNMAETVAGEMPSPAQIAACAWLTEAELAVYAEEYRRTGFQGGLQWYRARTGGLFEPELEVFAGRGIDVPACFIAGSRDWGIHQQPGALAAMAESVCTDWRGLHLVDGAGHWVQQERPEAVLGYLRGFLAGTKHLNT